jgi:peptide/nickel transport system permease protein
VGAYVARRFLYMLVLLLLTTMVSFAIIVLPPGDYLTSFVQQLESQGGDVTNEQVASLRSAYGLGDPEYMQYLKWMRGLLTEGDMGRSFAWRAPVAEVILDRLPMTLLTSLGSTVLVYLIAIPIGIYAAVKQYSLGDYIASFIGFIGLAIPNFLLGLVAMMLFYEWFGISVAGLYSPDMQSAPWSWDKFLDLLAHLPVPLFVIGIAGTAGIIRVMRATLLDELNQPYVETARAKGVSEFRLLMKYPVRVALNPIASTIGWLLPAMFSGDAITAIVMNLPTVGPVLLQSLLTEDMYLAAGIVMMLTVLTLVGTFLSDLALMWIDPRIRVERGR